MAVPSTWKILDRPSTNVQKTDELCLRRGWNWIEAASILRTGCMKQIRSSDPHRQICGPNRQDQQKDTRPRRLSTRGRPQTTLMAFATSHFSELTIEHAVCMLTTSSHTEVSPTISWKCGMPTVAAATLWQSGGQSGETSRRWEGWCHLCATVLTIDLVRAQADAISQSQPSAGLCHVLVPPTATRLQWVEYAVSTLPGTNSSEDAMTGNVSMSSLFFSSFRRAH